MSVFPVFMFTRYGALETPNRLLTGELRLNVFGQRSLSHRQRREWRKSSLTLPPTLRPEACRR